MRASLRQMLLPLGSASLAAAGEPDSELGPSALGRLGGECKEVEILCDAAEAASGIPDLLQEAGAQAKLCRLPAGDYLVAGRWLIERKAAGDFMASLYDGRLYRQLGYLSHALPPAMLVVEGCPGYYEGFWPPALRRTLLASFASFRVPLIFTRRAEGTARFILDLGLRAVRHPSPERFYPSSSEDAEKSAGLRMLAQLPGVGRRLAGLLLREFKSFEGVFQADEEELLRVRGIGREKARRMRAAFHGESGKREKS
ncbi:MAG: ERCC4 domain-containing protein [Elusimicrobiota bacterium]